LNFKTLTLKTGRGEKFKKITFFDKRGGGTSNQVIFEDIMDRQIL